MRHAFVVMAAMWLVTAANAAAEAQTKVARFALVVGSNKSPSTSIAPLRYADDDAIANHRTARLLGMTSVLLVTPDEDTRTLLPQLGATTPARRAEFTHAMRTLRTQVSAARATGSHTTLHVFFAGHGDLEGGRSFLQLEDGRLWPEDVADGVTSVGADETHVVIDACHAGDFIGARGPGGKRTTVAPGFSANLGPRWPAGTGFLTARSASGQTHEWVEFQGGIFSHEARSAMLGGADVNLDGVVTYRELAAFVARANAAVPNAKYRPHVIARPPNGDLDTPLAQLPEGPMLLQIDAHPTGHTFVETETGVRLADLHPAPHESLQLRLPVDMGPLFVQRVHPEAEYKVQPQAAVQLSQLEALPVRARARGAAQESFRHLFALPLERQSAAVYEPPAADVADVAEPPTSSSRKRWGWSAMGLGAAAVAAGAAFGISAHVMANDVDDATGIERERIGDSIDDRNTAAVILVSAGLLSAAIGAALVWWRAEEAGWAQ